jgi:hypothetical protein
MAAFFNLSRSTAQMVALNLYPGFLSCQERYRDFAGEMLYFRHLTKFRLRKVHITTSIFRFCAAITNQVRFFGTTFAFSLQ